MPIKKITKGSQTCYQYGSEGKMYCGSGAKRKATIQAKAIQASKNKKK